jgi:hypothetical protein
LRSAKGTALHVNDLVRVYREKVRLPLVEPSDKCCLMICSDFCTDVYRQIFYLDIAASYFDSKFQLRSIDLCCSPYREPEKSAESIIAVSV